MKSKSPADLGDVGAQDVALVQQRLQLLLRAPEVVAVQVRDEVSVERHVERRAVDNLVEQYVHAAHSVRCAPAVPPVDCEYSLPCDCHDSTHCRPLC